jgi:hypothetical protein
VANAVCRAAASWIHRIWQGSVSCSAGRGTHHSLGHDLALCRSLATFGIILCLCPSGQEGEKLDKEALMREAISGQMKERQDLERKLQTQVWPADPLLHCSTLLLGVLQTARLYGRHSHRTLCRAADA